MVGLKTGTATITITLTGGKDVNGNALEPITKTVRVTVVRGIENISGSIEVTQGSALDLSQFSITVTYTDGTTEKIPLNDRRIVLQNIDTETLGDTTYNVLFTDGSMEGRGILTVTVIAKGNVCGSAIDVVSFGIGAALLLSAGAVLIVCRKKRQ